MARKRRRTYRANSTEQMKPVASIPEPVSISPVARSQASAVERAVAAFMLFLVTVPLVLFVIFLASQLWSWVEGEALFSLWKVAVITPLGLIVAPVLFYLGWYFQVKAKNGQFDLGETMGGHFRVYCRSLYGVFAAVTLSAAIAGMLSSAFVDSNLVLTSWIGIAFVGIGLLSLLFRRLDEQSKVSFPPVSLKLIGAVLVVLAVIWLYPCGVSLSRQDWSRVQETAVLFVFFLVPGIITIWFSFRRRADRTGLG